MRSARILFFFLSIHFFLCHMGLLGRRISPFASVISLVLFVALSHSGGRWRWSRLVPGLGVLVTLIVIIRGSYEGVYAFPFLLAGLMLLPERVDHEPGERTSLMLASFIYATVVFLQFHVPSVWHFFHHLGLSISRLAGLLIGQEYRFGPSPSGIPIVLSFLIYHAVVARLAAAGGFRYFVKAVVLLFVLQGAVLVLLTPLAFLIQATDPSWDVLLLNPETFLFAGSMLTLLIRRPEPAPRAEHGGRAIPVALGLVALLCSIYIVLRPAPGAPGGRVLLYDRGYLNWKTPVHGMYGHKSGGMFGYLPRYLEAAGYEVVTVDTLSGERLGGARAVVVINVLEYFSDAEKEAVEEFVRRGGGLLALGDHTGVQGIRGPFNDLLEPFEIEFLFDTADFFTRGWGEEAVLMPHPITHGLYSPAEMDIWVGASLRIRPPAYPIVIGRYGFSDMGDIAAVDHAYLGNRIYDLGEQLGDIVLVAGNEYGSGRVLVFGDTSSFQNSALVTSYRFVARAISWLASGGSFGTLRHVLVPLILAIVAGIAATGRSAAAVGVVSLAVVVGGLIGTAPRRIEPDVALEMPTAVIDASHLERFDQLTWYDDCTGGLQYNLMRAGTFPLITQRFSPEQILQGEIAVIIAPVVPFTEEEAGVLDRFMEEGGWILYTCGTEERDGSAEFLARYGLQLLDLPLTTFIDTLGTFPVNVYEGWAIAAADSAAEIVAEQYELPYIVRIERGEGGMVLIADSHFLLCKNLEGMEVYFEGNIKFLRALFEGFRRGSTPAGKEKAGT